MVKVMMNHLVPVFCLVAVTSARELNKINPSHHDDKGVNIDEDPSKNQEVDKSQIPFVLPYPFPFPFPFPRLLPV